LSGCGAKLSTSNAPPPAPSAATLVEPHFGQGRVETRGLRDLVEDVHEVAEVGRELAEDQGAGASRGLVLAGQPRVGVPTQVAVVAQASRALVKASKKPETKRAVSAVARRSRARSNREAARARA
jgi:hypothetical protein